MEVDGEEVIPLLPLLPCHTGIPTECWEDNNVGAGDTGMAKKAKLYGIIMEISCNIILGRGGMNSRNTMVVESENERGS